MPSPASSPTISTSRNARVAALALSLAMLPTSAAVPLSPPPPDPPGVIRLDRPGRTTQNAAQWAPRVAVSTRGPVIAFDDDRDFRVAVRTRSDDAPVDLEVPVPVGGGDPILVAGGAGDVWLVGATETGDLITLRSEGDGRWQPGPSVGAGKIWSPSAATATPGGVLLGWAGKGGCPTLPQGGEPGAPRREVPLPEPIPGRVWTADLSGEAITEPASPLPGTDYLNVAVASGRDGTAWLAAAAPDRVDVIAREAGATAWTSRGSVPAGVSWGLALTVLADGEAVVAWAESANLRTAVRAPLSGKWTLEESFGHAASSVRLLADPVADTLPWTLTGELPVGPSGGATLLWVGGGGVRTSAYRPAVVAELAGTWSAAETVVEGAAAADAAWSGDALVVVADVAPPQRVVRLERAAGEWSTPAPAADPGTYAAGKGVKLLAATDGAFAAFWSDTEGTTLYDYSLRTARVAPEPVARTSSIPDVSAVAPDASSAGTWYDGNERRVEATTPDGVGTGSITFPLERDVSLAPMGAGRFVAVAPDGDDAVWYRLYADGAWQPLSRFAPGGPLPDLQLVPAGAGLAWITWTIFDGEFDWQEPLPEVAYRILGAPIGPNGPEAVRTLATGSTRHSFYPQFSGDGAGGIAVAWAEGPRLMFASTASPPVLLAENEHWFDARPAATPRGDAIVLARHDGIRSFRRTAFSSFAEVPFPTLEMPPPPSDFVILPAPCRPVVRVDGGASYPRPSAPRVAFDAAGVAHALIAGVDGLAHVTLPQDEGAWRTRTHSAVRVREWHPVAVALDGRIAAIWEQGADPDRRILAFEEALENPAPTALVVWTAVGSGYARLTTARGVPLAGRPVSITVDGITRQATTDADGVARVDGAAMREIIATFAASGRWSGSTASAVLEPAT